MKTLPHLVCLLITVIWIVRPNDAHAAQVTLADAQLDDICDPPAPYVTVKLRVPACALADKTLEYRMVVENRSSAPAHRVVVLDRLPANAKFVRASPQPHRTEPELRWELGTLNGHSCQEITLILAPTNAEDVTNCVRVQFEHGVCATTRQVGSGKLPDETPIPKKTKEPPLLAGARLKVSVKAPNQQEMNEPARYFITVANDGNEPARLVSIEAVLPDKLAFVSASNKGKPGGDKVAWSLGDLPPKESRSVELVVRAKEPGRFCIKTRAEFGEPKQEQFTEFSEACTTFLGLPGILLEMYDREDPIPVNGTTSYPIRIFNQGTGPATNVRIQAMVPEGMDLLKVSGPVNHKVKGKTIIFEPLTKVEPGARVEIEIFTRARVAGDLRFKIEMTADQLKEGGPVHQEESTTVYSEDAQARAGAAPGPGRHETVRHRFLPR